MRTCALLACVLAACSFREGSVANNGGDGGNDVDAAEGSDAAVIIDAAPDAPMPDASFCYGSGLVQTCFTQMPSGGVTLNADIDTDTSTLCDGDPRNQDWCVVAGTSISITTVVHATGTRPLVLLSTSSIMITGTLDASSTRAGQVGAGANAPGCNAGTAPTGAKAGGAGGSFGGLGGNGAGTGGGTAGAVLNPTELRGGCPGQNGGGGAGTGGVRGNGGGAVYLIAETNITVQGTVNASGAGGGEGKPSQGGGGGAGAGGMIGFDAPTVTVQGQAFANGGGGGEGGTSGGQDGNPGADPTSALTAAAGGTGSTSGGNGGTGAAGANPNGGNGAAGGGSPTAGSGGGGGGIGILKLYRAAAIVGTNVSPPPS